MDKLLPKLGPLVAGDSLLDFLPRSDLTYRSYVDQSIKSADLVRSMLIGTSFNNCKLENVKFDNCDIEGAQFIGCDFNDCSFLDADIRSCVFYRCTIQKCRFDQALLQDATVRDSMINESSFTQASIHDSAFYDSTLNNCSIKNSSALHNTFAYVTFEQMRIADCTFLYTLFNECKFNNVQMNVEAIGTTFGLSRENIQSLEMVYLGDVQQQPPQDMIDTLKLSYLDRKWNFSEAMLGVNYGPQPKLVALCRAVESLCKIAASGIGVKRDEFRFIGKVSEYLFELEQLPIGYLIHSMEITGQLLDGQKHRYEVRDAVQELHNKLFLMLQSAIDTYQDFANKLELPDDLSVPVLLTLTYTERPALDSAMIIRLAGEANPDSKYIVADLIDARHGSWIEIVQTTAMGVLALYALFVVTNGLFVQIIRARALAKALVQPIPKRTIQDLTKKLILSNDKGAQSQFTKAAMGWLSANVQESLSKSVNARAGVAADLHKLQSISIEAKGSDVV